MPSGVSWSRVMVTVEMELPRRASSNEWYGRWSCSFSCLRLLIIDPPRRLLPGFTEAGLPKSAPFGLLPHCQPGSWPWAISGM